ncbi:MAG: hypothetical protein KGH71_03910 [Candidatus Micrarchaeota archaeon]|nr:hypothetical protein [Candidatus Micrarchaeota archaeon]
MFSRLEKVDVYELQERVSAKLGKLANDHQLPYQTRKELSEAVGRLRSQFEELEELVEMKERLEAISADTHRLLTNEQRGEVYATVCWIEDFVDELKRNRESAK